MITIDRESHQATYEQICSQVAEGVRDGSFAVGSKLPTVRGLAATLGIAPGTVAKAYTELERCGLIVTRGRAGTFIAAGQDSAAQELQLAARELVQRVRRWNPSRAEVLAAVTVALAHENIV
ncbi:GntR family transcriptional regulator [Yimella sp. cx-51]|uniref:GntR family transcriptional regulator n=1 Tax=Yimella sp. cx-51 TaxID=2770551 RepID=UPI00165D355B|nr:GntR family transcriptional regulator [Yimella sp. cx-51]MBC9956878.1 GntR family transcriptional regulator [Yimella sp. cx-51]QTH39103.1 GntR family transcriptional regulator [Yimella sp. cx-51]